MTDRITYDGSKPDRLWDFVFDHLGRRGRLSYVWGGTRWDVTFWEGEEPPYEAKPVRYGDSLVWDGQRMRHERRDNSG